MQESSAFFLGVKLLNVFLKLLMEAIICILDCLLWVIFLSWKSYFYLACTGVGGGEEQDGGDHLHFGLSSLSYYFLACAGVGGGEEQDGGDHLHFGLPSLSYIFLPVQVLEEEKSKMEEIICILDCLLWVTFSCLYRCWRRRRARWRRSSARRTTNCESWDPISPRLSMLPSKICVA